MCLMCIWVYGTTLDNQELQDGKISELGIFPNARNRVLAIISDVAFWGNVCSTYMLPNFLIPCLPCFCIQIQGTKQNWSWTETTIKFSDCKLVNANQENLILHQSFKLTSSFSLFLRIQFVKLMLFFYSEKLYGVRYIL